MSKFDGPSVEEIILARRMNREGASLEDIHNAIGWACTIPTTQERLRRAGVRIRAGRRRLAHLGETTTTCEDWHGKRKSRKAQTQET